MPAWLKVCCPTVSSLEVEDCSLTPHLPDLPPPAPAAAPAPPPHRCRPAPLACQHLQRINVQAFGMGDGGGDALQEQQHIRQQLAALPSLTSLAMDSFEWMPEPALVSTTVTSLSLPPSDSMQHVPHLAAQFPNLRQLDGWGLTLDDAGLEALLRLPHLERLSVWDFDLQRSHAHHAWAVRHLGVGTLDVGPFARLPLDGVRAVSVWGLMQTIAPSGDAQAVARVAEAVRRWGGLGTEGVEVDGRDTAALLTTLGPLLAALPAEQRTEVEINDVRDATNATLRALGQQLPAGVATLRLTRCTLQPDAWPVLLPSLPASVTKLFLRFSLGPTEDQLVALCGAAVRPVTLSAWCNTAATVGRVKERLAELGKEQLVTFY